MKHIIVLLILILSTNLFSQKTMSEKKLEVKRQYGWLTGVYGDFTFEYLIKGERASLDIPSGYYDEKIPEWVKNNIDWEQERLGYSINEPYYINSTSKIDVDIVVYKNKYYNFLATMDTTTMMKRVVDFSDGAGSFSPARADYIAGLYNGFSFRQLKRWKFGIGYFHECDHNVDSTNGWGAGRFVNTANSVDWVEEKVSYGNKYMYFRIKARQFYNNSEFYSRTYERIGERPYANGKYSGKDRPELMQHEWLIKMEGDAVNTSLFDIVLYNENSIRNNFDSMKGELGSYVFFGKDVVAMKKGFMVGGALTMEYMPNAKFNDGTTEITNMKIFVNYRQVTYL